jgi:hypothetical protein
LNKAKTAILNQSRKLLRTAQEFRRKREQEQKNNLEDQHEQIISALQEEPLGQVPPDFEGEGHDVHFPLSTCPYYRNYIFLGRDDLLESISRHLGDDQPATNGTDPITNSPLTVAKRHDPKCCILDGLGGIGKTQSAVEYIYRYRNRYDAIFWLQSDSDQALAASFSDIAEKLHMVDDLEGHDGQNQGRAIKRAEKWLRSTRELLISLNTSILTVKRSLLVAGLR